MKDQTLFKLPPIDHDIKMAQMKDKYAKGGVITQTELGKIIPRQQFMVMKQAKEEYPFMISSISDALEKIPVLYSQKEKWKNAVVWLHYFSGGSDWYITELDKEDNIAWGFVIMNGNTRDAEFGGISLTELASIDAVNLDLYWSVKTINQALQKSGHINLVEEPVEIYSPNMEDETMDEVDNSPIVLMDFKNSFERNLAIRELIDDRGNNPENYTTLDKQFLSTYSGMGGLEKYGATGDSLKFEYYTSDDIVKKMWGLAFKHKTIPIKFALEPSVGTGRFLAYAPDDVLIDGYDIDNYAFSISKILYPEERFHFKLESFVKQFTHKKDSIKGDISGMEVYDLIIGNPPYGIIGGYEIGLGEQKYTGAANWVQYFIDRSLDLLKKDGLLVFIVGTSTITGGKPFLDSTPNKSIKRIQQKAELVDAYRLGVGAFDTTDVESDIIVLRKK